jgi:UDP-glucose 4-epimerase
MKIDFKKKNICITGGAGFIGSHLVEKLSKYDCNITIIDNLSTGRIENIKNFLKKSKIQIIKKDINQIKNLKKILKKMDFIFHLAALADIVPSIENPEKYFNSNVVATFNLLNNLNIKRTRKFIYLASSTCYGIPKFYPTKESEKINTKYPYALTKNIGEQLVTHWSNIYGLKSITLRLFNVFGTRSRTSGTYGAVFGVFLAQKIKNFPLTVVGNGRQLRDFTYVTDIVDAIILAALTKKSHEVYNVASGKPKSVNEIVKLLNHKKTHIRKRPGEPDITWADISKIRKDLKWKPKISFKKGVEMLLANIDYWKNAPVWTKTKIKKATKNWFKYLK